MDEDDLEQMELFEDLGLPELVSPPEEKEEDPKAEDFDPTTWG